MKTNARIIGLSVIAGFTLSASPGLAQPYYLQLDGGGAFFGDNEAQDVDIEYDVGYVVGARIGVAITENIRAEVDVSYTETEISDLDGVDLGDFDLDADVSALTFGVGLYADVLKTGSFTPYVGAGIGAAYKELDSNFLVDEEETDFQAHGELGVSFDLSPNIAVVPHYRLLWLDGVFDDEQFVHFVRLGVRLSP